MINGLSDKIPKMTLKEAFINTTMFDYLGSPIKVPVYYTDELVTTRVTDLAFSSILGGYLPYLFVGYFNTPMLQKWYFANARRHEEMREAVQREIGETDYRYGQIWFDGQGIINGELMFNRLIANQSLPDEAIRLLYQVIRPDLFHEDFQIIYSNV
jgi:hypothetical protein